jgi:hypothetical protein
MEDFMTRTAASLALVALALSACMTQPPQSSEPRIATQEMPYRTGPGVVIAAAPAPVSAVAAGTSAAAGASPAPAGASSAPYRLAIRMDAGGVQYVDTDNPEITVGSRVELGSDHTIRKL